MRNLRFLCFLLFASGAQAANWYVATNGLALNTGAFASPWDYQTALQKTNSILPGDTIWLMPGSYTHIPQGYQSNVNTGWIFKSYLSGTSNAPIWHRSYTNIMARIDGGQYSTNYAYFANGRPTMSVGDPQIPSIGKYNYFMDLEFYSSSTEARFAATDSSFPTEITRSDGPSLYTEGSLFINCMFHDTTTGGSTWMTGIGTGFYGCMFWSNGWQGTPSAHGHNIYAEGRAANANGLTKMIRRNLFSFPYQKNVQVYGSANAEICRFRVTQNGFIGVQGSHGGVLHGTKPGGNANRLQDNQFTDNWGWKADWGMAYQQDLAAYVDLLCANNYCVNSQFQMHSWQQATVTNNYFIEIPASFNAVAFESNCIGKTWTFDNNHYTFTSVGAQSFRFNGVFGPANFTSWKAFTHWDSNSTVTATFPSGTNNVILMDNAYNTNRAELLLYNWRLDNFIAVDVSSLNWPVGSSCSLRNSQDPLVDLVAATVTSTNTVIVDMRAASHTVAIPYGETGGALGPTTFPNYGQFWLTKDADAGPPSPPNYVSTISAFGPTAGVTITNAPVDIGGLGNGVTTYSRTNTSNTVTSITSPATVTGWNFSKWQRNGVDYDTARATTYTNLADVTFTALFTIMEHTLTVDSSNPVTGVAVTVSPVSNSGASDGTTLFTRLYNDAVIVSLTALNPIPNGNGFQKWNRAGVLYSTAAAITLTNDADRTFTAVYTNFVSPPTNTVLTFGGRRRAARF